MRYTFVVRSCRVAMSFLDNFLATPAPQYRFTCLRRLVFANWCHVTERHAVMMLELWLSAQ